LLEALESDDLGQQIWAECDEMGGMCHRLSASWLGHKLTLLKSKNKEHNKRLAFNLAHMKFSRISLLQIKIDGFQVTFLQSNNHVCWSKSLCFVG